MRELFVAAFRQALNLPARPCHRGPPALRTSTRFRRRGNSTYFIFPDDATMLDAPHAVFSYLGQVFKSTERHIVTRVSAGGATYR
jgi:hypothetical protein